MKGPDFRGLFLLLHEVCGGLRPCPARQFQRGPRVDIARGESEVNSGPGVQSTSSELADALRGSCRTAGRGVRRARVPRCAWARTTRRSGRPGCAGTVSAIPEEDFGAVEKTRTSTALRPQRPQRCASTSSATTAHKPISFGLHPGPASQALPREEAAH